MTKVKICGFTEPNNARDAALAGVDAIGLVFYDKSPRNVDIHSAQKIIEGAQKKSNNMKSNFLYKYCGSSWRFNHIY